MDGIHVRIYIFFHSVRIRPKIKGGSTTMSLILYKKVVCSSESALTGVDAKGTEQMYP